MNKNQPYNVYLLSSSSLNLASISLLGGYLGNPEGSQANGWVVKNCCKKEKLRSEHRASEVSTKRKYKKTSREKSRFKLQYSNILEKRHSLKPLSNILKDTAAYVFHTTAIFQVIQNCLYLYTTTPRNIISIPHCSEQKQQML